MHNHRCINELIKYKICKILISIYFFLFCLTYVAMFKSIPQIYAVEEMPYCHLMFLFSVLEISESWSTVLLLISGHRVPLNQGQMREVLYFPAVQISSCTTRSVWCNARNWAPENPWLLWAPSSRSICASMPGRSSLETFPSELSHLTFSHYFLFGPSPLLW